MSSLLLVTGCFFNKIILYLDLIELNECLKAILHRDWDRSLLKFLDEFVPQELVDLSDLLSQLIDTNDLLESKVACENVANTHVHDQLLEEGVAVVTEREKSLLVLSRVQDNLLLIVLSLWLHGQPLRPEPELLHNTGDGGDRWVEAHSLIHIAFGEVVEDALTCGLDRRKIHTLSLLL